MSERLPSGVEEFLRIGLETGELEDRYHALLAANEADAQEARRNHYGLIVAERLLEQLDLGLEHGVKRRAINVYGHFVPRDELHIHQEVSRALGPELGTTSVFYEMIGPRKIKRNGQDVEVGCAMMTADGRVVQMPYIFRDDRQYFLAHIHSDTRGSVNFEQTVRAVRGMSAGEHAMEEVSFETTLKDMQALPAVEPQRITA
jgi:hypothetical protein